MDKIVKLDDLANLIALAYITAFDLRQPQHPSHYTQFQETCKYINIRHRPHIRQDESTRPAQDLFCLSLCEHKIFASTTKYVYKRFASKAWRRKSHFTALPRLTPNELKTWFASKYFEPDWEEYYSDCHQKPMAKHQSIGLQHIISTMRMT